jgi:LPXTG-motif cell wall-anchored protein
MTQRVSSRRSVASGLACMVMGATALVGGFASPAGASPQTPAAPSCPAGYVEASGATAHAADAADTDARATGGEVVTEAQEASEVDAANLGTESGAQADGQGDILGGIVPRAATECVPEGWESGAHGPSPAAEGCCGHEEEPPGHECCTTTTEPPTTDTTMATTETTMAPTAELPRTGSTTGPMVAAGVGLLVVGGALVVGKRKLSQA